MINLILALWTSRLGKRQQVYVLLVHLFVYFARVDFLSGSPEQKAHWWAYMIGRPLSSVVCRPHSLNIFSSETTEPIKVKFNTEPPWDRRTKVCSNGHGHMTKMAFMPVYGKNLKKIFFSGSKRPMTLNLGMQHWVLEYYQICLNDDNGLTLTYFSQGQIWSLMLLYGKKVKQSIFQKLLSSMIWNYQQITEVTRSVCWHQNFVHLGAVFPCPGAIYMY